MITRTAEISRSGIFWPFRGHSGPVAPVAFFPDGKRIISGSNDKTVRIWDAETGALEASAFRGHTNEIWYAAFSPDGWRAIMGSNDKVARIWTLGIVYRRIFA